MKAGDLMMSEKQLLAKYEAERLDLTTKARTIAVRVRSLDDVIASLRAVLGIAGPVPGASSGGRARATGTKALILDTLADGAARGTVAIAAECKVTREAVRLHLVDLVQAGDVVRDGAGRRTRYRIP